MKATICSAAFSCGSQISLRGQDGGIARVASSQLVRVPPDSIYSDVVGFKPNDLFCCGLSLIGGGGCGGYQFQYRASLIDPP